MATIQAIHKVGFYNMKIAVFVPCLFGIYNCILNVSHPLLSSLLFGFTTFSTNIKVISGIELPVVPSYRRMVGDVQTLTSVVKSHSDVDVRPSGNSHVRKCGLNIVESPLVKMVSRGFNKMLTVSISITVFNTFSEKSDIVDKELAAAPIKIAKRGSGQALVGVAGATKNYAHQITKSIRPNVSTAHSTAPFSCSYVGLRGDAATSRSLTDFIRSLLETVATAEIR
ncbi:hypothetical protein F5879DRAFT_1022688 [Lentinula edodes]|nr:hypothetical protein F5879DRAFT_1022688 [Lentinula edodes]